eukprot:1621-Heterococcus_DN1.PRE.1
MLQDSVINCGHTTNVAVDAAAAAVMCSLLCTELVIASRETAITALAALSTPCLMLAALALCIVSLQPMPLLLQLARLAVYGLVLLLQPAATAAAATIAATLAAAVAAVAAAKRASRRSALSCCLAVVYATAVAACALASPLAAYKFQLLRIAISDTPLVFADVTTALCLLCAVAVAADTAGTECAAAAAAAA